MKCSINRECVFCHKVYNNLASHIKKYHKNITLKDYYDTYIEPGIYHKCENVNCCNEATFTFFSYRRYCSRKCAVNDNNTIKKNYETFIKNHPNDPYSSLKEKREQTIINKWGSLKEERKQSKIKEIKTKIDNNTLCPSKYLTDEEQQKIIDKRKSTYKLRTGYEWSAQNPDSRMKMEKTKKDRYDNENYNNSKKAQKTKLDNYGYLYFPPDAKPSHTSKGEIEVYNFIKEIYKGKIIQSDTKILNGKELDIYLPELKIGIEFDGIFWHMDSRFYNEMDYNKVLHKTAKELWEKDEQKNILCENNNIKLLRIKEYDWKTNKNLQKEVLKNFILNKL